MTPTKIVVVLSSTDFLFSSAMSAILSNSMLKSSFIHPTTVASLKKKLFFFPFFAISIGFHFAPNSRFVEVALDSWSLSWCDIGGFSSSWFPLWCALDVPFEQCSSSNKDLIICHRFLPLSWPFSIMASMSAYIILNSVVNNWCCGSYCGWM